VIGRQLPTNCPTQLTPHQAAQTSARTWEAPHWPWIRAQSSNSSSAQLLARSEVWTSHSSAWLPCLWTREGSAETRSPLGHSPYLQKLPPWCHTTRRPSWAQLCSSLFGWVDAASRWIPSPSCPTYLTYPSCSWIVGCCCSDYAEKYCSECCFVARLASLACSRSSRHLLHRPPRWSDRICKCSKH